MWICLSDAFFSIVHKDCARDEVLVRARRPGDIEKVFPGATVVRVETADYLFRAVVKRREVGEALAAEVQRITYSNFKSSVQDDPLHDAYMRVWTVMSTLQPNPPWGSAAGLFVYDRPDPITNLKSKYAPFISEETLAVVFKRG